MININNVSFSYNDDITLENINLNIKKGEVILLCGESGCGKTTMTRFLNGLIPNFFDGNRKGSVYMNGNLIDEMKIYEISEYIGSVFQNPKTQFFNVDTTSELVFGCENLAIDKDEIERRLEMVVNDFDLEHLLNKNIFELSGGEKQKIACASVSAVFPDILVLDEPSSNLDSQSTWYLGEIIKKWKSQGKTVIIAEHKLFFLENVVDKVIFIKNGRITNIWPISEFKNISHKDWGLRQLNLGNLTAKCGEYYSNTQEFLEFKDFKFKYKKNPCVGYG